MKRILFLMLTAWGGFAGLWSQNAPTSIAGSRLMTLEDCIGTALNNSISLQQAQLNEQGARFDATAAGAAFLPSVNANSGYFTNSGLVVDPVTNTVSRTGLSSASGSLVASLNVFDGFQTYHNYRRAQVDAAASALRYVSGQYEVVLNVSLAYLQVLMAQEAHKVAQEQERLSLRLVERAQKIRAVGSGTPADVYQIQAQHARDAQRAVTTQNQVELTRLALFQAMNAPVDLTAEFVVPSGSNETQGTAVLLSSPIAVLYEASNERQPSIQVAQLSVRSAFHAVKAAKASYLPRLSVNGQWSTTYSNLDLVVTGQQTLPMVVGYWVNPLDPGQRIDVYRDFTVPTGTAPKAFGNQITDNVRQFVGLSMNVPLFNALQVRNAVQRAELARASAELNVALSEQQYRQTLERAQLDAKAALAQFKAAETAAQASKENADYAFARREEGMLSAYDYSSAVNTHLAAVSEVLRAKYDWFFKRKVLELYVNGLPIDELDDLGK
jgi:outer membrane protein